MTRPTVVMEREDYAATLELLFLDVKARFRIHNYEVKKLSEDFLFCSMLSPIKHTMLRLIGEYKREEQSSLF